VHVPRPLVILIRPAPEKALSGALTVVLLASCQPIQYPSTTTHFSTIAPLSFDLSRTLSSPRRRPLGSNLLPFRLPGPLIATSVFFRSLKRERTKLVLYFPDSSASDRYVTSLAARIDPVVSSPHPPQAPPPISAALILSHLPTSALSRVEIYSPFVDAVGLLRFTGLGLCIANCSFLHRA
jgi:hypothetical protein